MGDDDKDKEELDNVPDASVDDEIDPNIKPFYLVLKAGGEKKVFMSKEKIGVDRIAKIKKEPHKRNALLFYDKRTKTIRLLSERNFVLSNKFGKALKKGHKAVFRRILNGKVEKDQELEIGKHNVFNKGKNCLDVDGKNAEMAPLQWWTCNKDKATQKFEKVEKEKHKGTPDFTKQRFLIKLEMKGNRNVYLSKEKIGDEFTLKLGKKPNEWRSWFIVDKRTQTIRLYTQPHLAISNLKDKGVKEGKYLVMRKYDKADHSQPFIFNGKKVQNSKSKRCLSTEANQNKDDIHLIFWPCTAKETQKWKREVVPGNYEELCEDKVKEGKRYKVCPGKKDKYLGPHCVRHVELKHGKETLVKKCGDKTWEVAKCHRYEEKGQWFRKCGADHLEKVKGRGKLHSSN